MAQVNDSVALILPNGKVTQAVMARRNTDGSVELRTPKPYNTPSGPSNVFRAEATVAYTLKQ